MDTGEINHILVMIHALIDEQMAALDGKLTPEMATEYELRAKQIRELLEALRPDASANSYA